jgi:hypothetical protein
MSIFFSERFLDNWNLYISFRVAEHISEKRETTNNTIVLYRYTFIFNVSWSTQNDKYTLYNKKYSGHAVALLVEALCNKPVGRKFDSRWGHSIFH